MQLRAWRKLKALPRIKIAEAIGTSEVSVLRHERGERFPGAKLQEKYLQLTEGAVTPQDWLDLSKNAELGRDPEDSKEAEAA